MNQNEEMYYNLPNRLHHYFKPGRVIYLSYWQSYDKVLAFNEYPYNSPELKGKRWEVTVIACDAQGNPLKNAKPRVHSTYPDPRDEIIIDPK